MLLVPPRRKRSRFVVSFIQLLKKQLHLSSFICTRTGFVILLFTQTTFSVQNAYADTFYSSPYRYTLRCASEHPYFNSIDAAINAWWSAYQQCWGSYFPCSYDLTQYPGNSGDKPALFAGMLLTGNCGGGDGIWGTAYETEPTPDIEAATNNGNPRHCSNPTNPINLKTGNKHQKETDYTSPIASGLRFERHYNSNSEALKPGLLGRHWRSSYDRKLVFTVDATSYDMLIAAHRADGKAILFNKIDDEWVSVSDKTIKLAHEINNSGEATGWWELHNSNDTVETYNKQGKLISITSRAGFTQSLAYDLSAASGEGDDNPETLDRVTGPFGRTLHFRYYPQDTAHAGLLWKLIDPAGHEYVYDYDATANLISVTYPTNDNSIVQRYYHYEDPRHPQALTGITDETGQRYASWTYNPDGKATSSEHGPSNSGIDHYQLSFNVNGSTTLTSPTGHTQTYYFETHHYQHKIARIDGDSCSSCGSNTETTRYDSNGHVERTTDKRGTVTDYTMTVENQETQRIEAFGHPDANLTRTINTFWETDHRLPDKIEQGDRRIDFNYYPNGQLEWTEVEMISTGEKRRTTYTYTDGTEQDAQGQPIPAGLLKTIDGPRTDVEDITRYEYYNNGNLRKITNPIGNVTEITEYDPHGRPTHMTDMNGNSIIMTYHPRGWLKTHTLTDGFDSSKVYRTEYQYDNVGQLDKIYLPSHTTSAPRFLDHDYDAAHRLTDITDNDGNTIHYILDKLGNRLQEHVSDASGVLRKTLRQYNILNQLEFLKSGIDKTINPTEYWENKYEYDANGNQEFITDGKGIKTKYVYDAHDRVHQVIENFGGLDIDNDGTIDVQEAVTTYRYDEFDHLTSVEDPNGNITSYSVTVFGDTTQIDSPDTGITQMPHYDKAGNVKTMIDARGITASYTYDAANNIERIDYSDGSYQDYYFQTGSHQNISDGQNDFGRIRYVTTSSPLTVNGVTSDDKVTEYYEYDARGNIDYYKRQFNFNIVSETFYHYDDDSNLIKITYPNARVVDYHLDTLGRVNSITTTTDGINHTALVSNILYHPFGPVKSYILGNGVTVTHTLDMDYRLKSLQAGSSIFGKSYTYDKNSNIDFITDNTVQNLSKDPDYDVFNRLDVFKDKNGNIEYDYDYDANGNRTHKTGLDAQGHTEVVDYGISTTGNQLQDITIGAAITPLAYDANGNTLNDGTYHYEYDALNTLRRVTDGTNELARYFYDHQNLRVYKKTPSQGTVIYSYDLQGQLIAETDPQGHTLKEYIYLGDRPIALYDYTAAERVITVIAQGRQQADTLTLRLNLSQQRLETFHSETFGDSNNPESDWGIATEQWHTEAGTIHYSVQYGNGLMLILRHFDDGSSTCSETGGDDCKAAYIMVAQEGTAEYFYETYLEEAMVITEEQQAELLFYVNDHLNTPQQLVDRAGVVQWSAEYTPFGEARVSPNSTVTQNLRFSGQYYDEETGCHYNWNRYYCPAIGRYITSDPIGLNGGLNTYLYAMANPLRFVDPYGLFGIYGVGEFDAVIGVGLSMTGGGYVGSNGSGTINSASQVAGVEIGFDLELGFYWGDQPPKNSQSWEIDIDFGPVNVSIGRNWVGFGGGLGTPGVVFNPGGGVDITPNSDSKNILPDSRYKSSSWSSPDPSSDQILDIFCRDNPNAPNCSSNTECY